MTDTGDRFWTRGKLIGGAVAAMCAALVYLFSGLRVTVEVLEVPTRLAVHEQTEAAWRTAHERAFTRTLLSLCEELGRFPSECAFFAIHDGGEP